MLLGNQLQKLRKQKHIMGISNPSCVYYLHRHLLDLQKAPDSEDPFLKMLKVPPNVAKKKKLMGIVKKKQGQLRKLQRICKEKGKIIKSFRNIDESPEINNIFKGMSSTAVQFMISQIRCAKRPSHGRRWTLDEKVPNVLGNL